MATGMQLPGPSCTTHGTTCCDVCDDVSVGASLRVVSLQASERLYYVYQTMLDTSAALHSSEEAQHAKQEAQQQHQVTFSPPCNVDLATACLLCLSVHSLS